MAVFNMSRDTSRLCLQSLACLLVLSTAQLALAEPAAPKANGDKTAAAARADELAQQGAEAAAEGDLETARDKLSQAFEFKPAYDIAGNLGGVEYGLGRYRDAAEHLSFSLRMYPATGNPDQRAQTANFLKEARLKTCEVTLKGPPTGASMLIDGSRSAALDSPQHYLAPGKHTLSLSAPGYEPTRKQYTCKAGDSTTLRIQMKRAKPVASNPNETESGVPLWPVAVGGGLTLAAAGLGTGMWFAHQGVENDASTTLEELKDQADSTTPCPGVDDTMKIACRNLKKQRGREALYEDTSIVAFITSGVAALATVGYFVGYTVSTDSSDSETNSAQSTSARVHFTPSSVTLDVSF